MVKTKLITWNRKPLIKNFKKTKKVFAFIQARQGSTRLPNKIYEDINGAPMLWHTVSRAKECKLLDDVIVVSPQALPELPENVKGFVFDGDEQDVLGRYVAALKAYPCDYVVRLTSDCPLLDPHLIDYVISQSLEADYGTNVLPCTFPDGLDTEVISADTLKVLDKFAIKLFDREHVTTYIRNDPYVQSGLKIVSIQNMDDLSYVKISVDTQEDLDYVRKIEKELCPR